MFYRIKLLPQKEESIMIRPNDVIEMHKQLLKDEIKSQEVKLEKMKSKAYAIADKFSDEQQSYIKVTFLKSEEKINELKVILAKLDN